MANRNAGKSVRNLIAAILILFGIEKVLSGVYFAFFSMTQTSPGSFILVSIINSVLDFMVGLGLLILSYKIVKGGWRLNI